MKITKYEQVWEIWSKAKEQLYVYILSRFKNKELAEEVTQEVLLKIHKSCCSQKEIINLNSWLYQIAHNASLDILKKEAKQKQSIQFAEIEGNSTKWAELSSFLEPLIDFLPEKYANPLKMADIEGIPQKDIAAKLGITLSSTKSRIQRARKQLKQEIETCYHFERDRKGVPTNIELKDSCIPLKQMKKKK